MVLFITTSKAESSALERGVVGQQSDAISAMQAVQATVPVTLTTQDHASFLVPLSEQVTLLPHQDFNYDIPVIDLSGSREDTMAALTGAAASWGVFQVVNHGMPASSMTEILAAAREFFSLPEEEKLASAADHTKDVPQGYKPMANAFHQTASWSNVLEYVLRPHHLSPTKEAFPSAAFRASVENFAEGLHQVMACLVELLLTAHLGPKPGTSKSNKLLDANHVQVFRIASYEPCPQPDAVMGIRSHVDHTLVSALVQDDTGGLQVEKDGQWHGVAPLPGAIVIVMGTVIQVITNNKIQAVKHRAVVNSHSSRISITSAVNPSNDTILFPALELVDETQPPLYRPFKYGEFRVQAFEDGILNSKDVVEKFRILPPVDAKPAPYPVGDEPCASKLDRDGYLPDLLRFERAGVVVN